MSQLKVTNIEDSTGKTVNTKDVTNGVARAWVNFNGTGTVAVRASYNVTSITDNGTGDYWVNFTTALADSNYSVNAIGGSTDATFTTACMNVTTLAVSQVRVKCNAWNVGTSGYDGNYNAVTIFR